MTMHSIEPLHTAKRVSRLVEITAPSAFLEFMTAGNIPRHLRTLSSLSPIEIWPVAVGLVSQ